jgi:hypothetical protein
VQLAPGEGGQWVLVSLGDNNVLVVQGPDTAADALQAHVLNHAIEQAHGKRLSALSPHLLEVWD